MREGSEIVETGRAVYEVRQPQIRMIYREYTNGQGRITTLGTTAREAKGAQRILVGTSTGRVFVHDPWGEMSEETPQYERVIYKDSDCRQITSVGGFKAKNVIDKTMEYFVFVQVRTFGVIILKDISDQPEYINGVKIFFKEVKIIESDHHGFCPCRAYDRRLFMPTSDDFLLVYMNDICMPIRLKSKGSPMCMDLLCDSPVVGSEDGVVAIYRTDFSQQDHPWELSVMEKVFDSPVFSLVVYNFVDVIVGSVGQPIKVLDGKTLAVKRDIHFPATARGCGALSYNFYSSSDADKQFIAGFWDGSIRIYREKKDGSFVEKSVIDSQQECGDRRSTSSLVWMIKDELYSACEDGNLYSYEIFKTRKLTEMEKEEYLRKKKESSK